jgi:hypothetical protein
MSFFKSKALTIGEKHSFKSLNFIVFEIDY